MLGLVGRNNFCQIEMFLNLRVAKKIKTTEILSSREQKTSYPANRKKVKNPAAQIDMPIIFLN